MTKRAPFQILVFPFLIVDRSTIQYVLFKRTDGYWQGIAGGGERDETPMEAARRETLEESGIVADSRFVVLKEVAQIPVMTTFGKLPWGDDVLTIPEHSFGVKVANREIKLSDEHTDYKWVEFDQARLMLHWHSNKTALHKLHQLLLNQT